MTKHHKDTAKTFEALRNRQVRSASNTAVAFYTACSTCGESSGTLLLSPVASFTSDTEVVIPVTWRHAAMAAFVTASFTCAESSGTLLLSPVASFPFDTEVIVLGHTAMVAFDTVSFTRGESSGTLLLSPVASFTLDTEVVVFGHAAMTFDTRFDRPFDIRGAEAPEAPVGDGRRGDAKVDNRDELSCRGAGDRRLDKLRARCLCLTVSAEVGVTRLHAL